MTEAEILEFARKFDPQWFHTDPKRAAEGRWGGLIASGWHTCALAMRMAVDAALHDSESSARPAWASAGACRCAPATSCGWTPGCRACASLLASDLGIITWAWTVLNQHDEAVLELDATSLFDLSGNA